MNKSDGINNSQILEWGKTPAQWVENMAKLGIVISERTLRERANDHGAFYRLGRTMLITPQQIDIIFEGGKSCSSNPINVATSTGPKVRSSTTGGQSLAHIAEARNRLLKLARGTG